MASHEPPQAAGSECCRDHIDLRARGGCRERQLERDITSLEHQRARLTLSSTVGSAQNGGLRSGPGGTQSRSGACRAMGRAERPGGCVR